MMAHGNFVRLAFTASLYAILMFGASSSDSKPRTLFPFDFVKFNCTKSQDVTKTMELENSPRHNDLCSWTFLTITNANLTKVTKAECVRTKATNQTITKGGLEVFEGYVEVPDNAEAIGCADKDGEVNYPVSIHIQKVKVAKPITRYESNTPTIVLQRFSNDYGVRLTAHDVTNEDVTIDGKEVDGMKLLCIHDAKVEWVNVTKPRQRVLRVLNDRDHTFILSKSDKKEKSLWNAYFRYLWYADKDFTKSANLTRSGMDMQTIYSLPLTFRRLTNESSRTYECRSLESEESSFVTLRIENPRLTGPDEIQMIQQIVGILDGLAQGKGKEPWYTLASLISIILIVFMYYCRLKLQQQQPPHQCAPKPAPPPEEAEMRRLQVPSPSQTRASTQTDPEQGPSHATTASQQV